MKKEEEINAKGRSFAILVIYVVKRKLYCLEVLAQLSIAEIAKPNVVIRIRTWDLTVVCGFNLSRLSLHLRQK